MENALISRADILKAAATIEPLPASISRLMSLVAEDDYDAAAIVDIVTHDPTLAGDVLARANSAISGSQRMIGDLQQATARIGANSVVEIAIRRTMQARLAGEVAAYGLGPNDLWRHAVTASVAGDVIRKRATKLVVPMISTAALVHDIGKLVIAKCLPSALTDSLFAAAKADSLEITEVERQVLGIDHGEVGGLVVRNWGLPVVVQSALTQHHAPDTTDTFTHALILADRIAHAVTDLDSTSPDDDDLSPLLENAAEHATAVGIDPSTLASLVVDSADLARDVVASY
jgi:HD-like signal output (HDOD) protein